MIQLMNDNELTELELEKDGLKIKLKKSAFGDIHTQVLSQPKMAQQPSSMTHAAPENQTPPPRVPEKAIQSPMVGTFYSAPAPDAPAFVSAGDQIKVGQVLCIIEAMKLMNEIKSEVSGKVVKVLIDNGGTVEFGQPLFLFE